MSPNKHNRLLTTNRWDCCFYMFALMLSVTIVLGASNVAVCQELEKQASWRSPDQETVLQWIQEWAQAANVDATVTRDEFESRANQHPDGSLGVVMDLLCEFFPFVAPSIEAFDRKPVDSADWKTIPGPGILNDPRLPESGAAQIQLVAACWFVRYERYDEAIEMFSGLAPEQVVAPADLLFYKGMAEQRLLLFESSTKSLNRLLENENLIPRRFSVVARLMVSDIKTMEKDSMDEIARLMEDIRRRQALHRSGTRVIDQEKKVISKLDKMIEDIEKKMQQASKSAGGQGGSAKPMQESKAAGGLGKGDVTDRQLEEGGKWGSLPPRKRAAALAEMARDLPPHYREVIEEYFRQLAKEPNRK